MPLDRVTVGDFAAWGRLVKTWATGHDYLMDGHAYPLPRNIDEFKAQVKQAGCRMTIPARLTKLDIVQGDDSTLVVRLPPGQMVLESEQKLAAMGNHNGGAAYPMPAFYYSAWPDHPPIKFDGARLQLFHNERIGEYTINNCM